MNLVYLPLSSTNCEYACSWFGENRQYDILINNWGYVPDFYRDCNPEFYFEIKEHKFRTLVKLYSEQFKLLNKYDFVLCPDPDLITNVDDINRLFDVAKQFNLDLCQPSITGYLNHNCLAPVKDRNTLIRHMGLVEPMCPMFSRKAMFTCLWTFNLSYSAWGLDFVWPLLVANETKSNIGVINTVAVEHSRPCVSQHLVFENGKTPWIEHRETLELFGLTTHLENYHTTKIHHNLLML